MVASFLYWALFPCLFLSVVSQRKALSCHTGIFYKNGKLSQPTTVTKKFSDQTPGFAFACLFDFVYGEKCSNLRISSDIFEFQKTHHLLNALYCSTTELKTRCVCRGALCSGDIATAHEALLREYESPSNSSWDKTIRMSNDPQLLGVNSTKRREILHCLIGKIREIYRLPGPDPPVPTIVMTSPDKLVQWKRSVILGPIPAIKTAAQCSAENAATVDSNFPTLALIIFILVEVALLIVVGVLLLWTKKRLNQRVDSGDALGMEEEEDETHKEKESDQSEVSTPEKHAKDTKKDKKKKNDGAKKAEKKEKNENKEKVPKKEKKEKKKEKKEDKKKGKKSKDMKKK